MKTRHSACRLWETQLSLKICRWHAFEISDRTFWGTIGGSIPWIYRREAIEAHQRLCVYLNTQVYRFLSSLAPEIRYGSVHLYLSDAWHMFRCIQFLWRMGSFACQRSSWIVFDSGLLSIECLAVEDFYEKWKILSLVGIWGLRRHQCRVFVWPLFFQGTYFWELKK